MYSFSIIKNKTYLSSNQEIDYKICALTNYCAVAFFSQNIGQMFSYDSGWIKDICLFLKKTKKE